MKEYYFLCQPNKIIPNMLKKLKCGKRWGRDKKPRLVRQD
jgi:hypothetical protein